MKLSTQLKQKLIDIDFWKDKTSLLKEKCHKYEKENNKLKSALKTIINQLNGIRKSPNIRPNDLR